jgi:hypothetical protein
MGPVPKHSTFWDWSHVMREWYSQNTFKYGNAFKNFLHLAQNTFNAGTQFNTDSEYRDHTLFLFGLGHYLMLEVNKYYKFYAGDAPSHIFCYFVLYLF